MELALRLLAERGVLEEHGQGGFAVAAQGALSPAFTVPEPDGEEAHYLALVRDRVATLVPARITESALLYQPPAERQFASCARSGCAFTEARRSPPGD